MSFPSPPSPEACLRATLLGTPRFEWQGAAVPLAAPRLIGVLTYLALNGPSSRETLEEQFWPGRGPQHVRQALYSLRALPGAGAWLDAGPAVSVKVVTDVMEVEAWTRRPEATPDLLAGWPTDPLFASCPMTWQVPFEAWLLERRADVLNRQARALGRWGTLALERRDFALAQRVAQLWLELDELDEAAYQLLTTALGSQGHLEEAREVVARCTEVLRRELDSEPAPATLAALRVQEGRSGIRHDRATILEPSGPWPWSGESLCGRGTEVRDVHDLLARHGRVVIQGLAGIGKTRLAQALAERVLRPGVSPGHRVVWLTLGSDSPEAATGTLADVLQVPATRDEPLTPSRIATALAAVDAHLVILDDAWSAATLEHLLALLPAGVPVVVTSRDRHPGQPTVTLHRLERLAARALLCAWSPTLDPDDVEVDALCALLGDHPYAVRLAARTLGSTGESLGSLLGRLQRAPHHHGEPDSLRALIGHSVDGLGAAAYEAFLGFGAMFAATVTPDLLGLAVRRPPEAVEEALYTLVQRGLASRETWPGHDLVRYRMHDLTWRAARDHGALQERTVLAAVQMYATAYTTDPARLDAERPALIEAIERALQGGRGPQAVAVLCGWLGGPYLAARGFPVAHLPLLEAGIQAAQTSRNWPGAALLCGKLGDIQQGLLSDHHAGIASYDRAAGYAAKAGVPERQAVFLALGGTLRAMNRLPGAQEALEHAQRCADVSGDALCQARVLEQRGFAHAMQRDFVAAREAFIAVRARLKPLLDPAQPRRDAAQIADLTATGNLAQAEQRLGHLDAALALREEALALALERDEHVHIAHARCDLGEVYALRGEPRAAREQFEQAIDLYRLVQAGPQEAAARMLLNALPAPV